VIRSVKQKYLQLLLSRARGLNESLALKFLKSVGMHNDIIFDRISLEHQIKSDQNLIAKFQRIVFGFDS